MGDGFGFHFENAQLGLFWSRWLVTKRTLGVAGACFAGGNQFAREFEDADGEGLRRGYDTVLEWVENVGYTRPSGLGPGLRWRADARLRQRPGMDVVLDPFGGTFRRGLGGDYLLGVRRIECGPEILCDRLLGLVGLLCGLRSGFGGTRSLGSEHFSIRRNSGIALRDAGGDTGHRGSFRLESRAFQTREGGLIVGIAGAAGAMRNQAGIHLLLPGGCGGRIAFVDGTLRRSTQR